MSYTEIAVNLGMEKYERLNIQAAYRRQKKREDKAEKAMADLDRL